MNYHPAETKSKLYLIEEKKKTLKITFTRRIDVFFFLLSKQQLVVLKIMQEEMSYRKQNQETLRIKLTELRRKGGWQPKSGIIKIHIGGSPNWI